MVWKFIFLTKVGTLLFETIFRRGHEKVLTAPNNDITYFIVNISNANRPSVFLSQNDVHKLL